MFPHFNDIAASNIYYRATYALRRVYHYVVILCHMKCIKLFDLFARLVQNTFVNRVWYTIVDKFCKDKAIFTFVKHLECVCWKGYELANVGVTSKDIIDVSREFSSLVFIDGVRHICG